MTAGRIARLRALAAPGSGATTAERETAERMIRRAERARRAYETEETRAWSFESRA